MNEQTRRNMCARYRENLYIEDKKAWFELEKILLTLQARLGLDEADSLELACSIIAGPMPSRAQSRAWDKPL